MPSNYNPPTGSPITGISSIQAILTNIVVWVQWGFFTVAVIFFFMAGFTYLQAGGNPESVKQAHNRIMYATIALIVGLMAYGMQTFVLNSLNTLTAGH